MLDIRPNTKIGEMLDEFPQLEDTLIELAPAFRKLKNPMLKRTVAKVTSVNQAALVGKIELYTLLNALRIKAGQEPVDVKNINKNQDEPPVWFKTGTIVKRIDARPMLERGEHPLGLVTTEVKDLEPGQILELTTPFYPAPLVDKIVEKGYMFWGLEKFNDDIRSYFTPA